ncbi:MAG: nucleoside-diphosphate kinase [Chloroflexi bacterium]|nr:nucleoside-diphosphate kinase [Chloroflexota bacterium]
MEQTLILVKPDGVQRGLIGTIIARLEQRGLRIVALKMLQMDRALAERHYGEHAGKFFFEDLVSYISSSPIVALVAEGPSAVSVVRAMVGATRPAEAAPGTIRGDFAVAGLRNLIHASDGVERAKVEMALFFKGDEVFSYTRDVDKWIYEK